jgi:hypothetical protein
MTYIITLSLILLLPLSLKAYSRFKKYNAKKKFEAWKKELFIEFVHKHALRISEWQLHHKEDPPIYWDPVAKEWIWLNNKQRKKMRDIYESKAQ